MPLRRKPTGETCSVAGCERVERTKGMCGSHYSRLCKYGDPRADRPFGKQWAEDDPRRRRVGVTQKTSSGYIEVWDPEHPSANGAGWILEHRRVMSEIIGRAIRPDETVHHRNGIKDDNSPENLQLRIGMHGSGGDIEEVVAWAREIVARYGHIHVGAKRVS